MEGVTTSQVPARVIVADDDPLICQALTMILRDYSDGKIDVIGVAHSGSEVRKLLEENDVHVVLMDIAMPGEDGITATTLISRTYPQVKVLMLTSLNPQDVAMGAIEAGAAGFVSKTDAPEVLVGRICEVAAGKVQFNAASMREIAKSLHDSRPNMRRDHARRVLSSLAEREYEAVILAAEGLTNAEIAKKMYISERTVKAHLSSASDKLSLGRVQLARLVERAELFSEE